LLQRYRRNAEAALNWMLQYGDRDGDGFQEYSRRSTQGLFNQGWKDSWDGIRHADGSIPEAPIALCELQGYAFDALLRMTEIYDLLKDPEKAADLRDRARHLYQQFNAERVLDRLVADDMWSGWGIRTLSSKHPGYNPYSYHCDRSGRTTTRQSPVGSAGLAGTPRRSASPKESSPPPSGSMPTGCPNLFSGLPRDTGAFPVPYLGANVPQAWAAAAVFRLVAILCGIHTVGRTRTMYVNPDLPDWLPSLTLRNLRAGRGSMELHLERDRVQVVGNTTGFKVVHGRLRPALVEAPLARG